VSRELPYMYSADRRQRHYPEHGRSREAREMLQGTDAVVEVIDEG
jgi:hypothetical protein